MDTRSSNQTNAIRLVCAYLSIASNVSITNAITAFAAVLTTVKNKLILIDTYDLLATATTSGVTLDVRSIRSVMESIAFKCSRAVIAYASQAPVNNTLIAKVKYSKSKLKATKKEDIGVVCEAIRKAANDNITNVQNYGISATDVSDLAAAISLYYTATANPRQMIIDKNSAKASIKNLIREVNQNLFKNQIDSMVLTLQASNSEFVSKYFLAREIIDLGKSHTKIKATAKDMDGNALPGTILKIMKTETTEVVYSVKANNQGVMPNTYVLPGDYDFLVERTGFNSITETNIHFSPGETVKRDFILLPV